MRLAGRTAVVTGAAAGIGRAIARRFAQEGAHVVVADVRGDAGSSRDGGPPTAKLIETEGGLATFVQGDLTDPAQVTELFDRALEVSGRIDIVVSNAGVFRGSPILDTTVEAWDADMDLNLRSQYLVNRRAVAEMIGQREVDGVRGRIVNMASQLGVTAPPGHLTYSVAKAGVAQMTRQLAVDYARHGIIVNAIAPGRVITGYHAGEADYLADGTVDAATEYSLQRTPFPRLGRPEDIAGAALFLASDDCTFVSGHLLMVDGGWTAY
ncbi:SDR family NAD(P)-dependent oxidoreductase [Streptosporangium amethystogenes]|uniref:SDR family NAD(P)-dependent oxidoreductase n=1 Tax=Streptosporangium amethystogenes TaxID=2002 RepID=UPI00379F5C42